VVRTLLFPITYRQVKSMRKMQELKPNMDRIKVEHKDDVPRQREEIARLYRERKVNPLGGCLPIFVQIPIFLVLYYTIRHFDRLDSFRTGGLFWFTDLTAADPLFILPVAYVVTMMASQELAMRNTVAQQKQIMRFMPIAFGVFLARFPAGLYVYWVTSNLITLCQNYVIYRHALHPPVAEAGPAAVPEDTTRKGQGEKVAPAPKTAESSTKSGRAKSRKKKGASKKKR
jgi:YidC/Oxa1 family membrane protein insertase